MTQDRQDPTPDAESVRLIEEALMRMRRDAQARRLQRRGERIADADQAGGAEGAGGADATGNGAGTRGGRRRFGPGGPGGPNGFAGERGGPFGMPGRGGPFAGGFGGHAGHDAGHHDGHGPHDRSLGGAARFRLLDALEQGPRTISELAVEVGVDQPRASRLVAEAVEKGFARRGVDPADARRAVVELTASGRQMLASAHETRRSAVETALTGFTPAEAADLARLLTRFLDAWPR